MKDKKIKKLKKYFRNVEFELRNRIWNLENPKWKFEVGEKVKYYPEPMATIEDAPIWFKVKIISQNWIEYPSGKIYYSPWRIYSIKFKGETIQVKEYYLSKYED